MKLFVILKQQEEHHTMDNYQQKFQFYSRRENIEHVVIQLTEL
jgi:hypothetical protein